MDRFSYSARVKLRPGSVVRHRCLRLPSVFCSVLTLVYIVCVPWLIGLIQTNQTNNHSEVIKRVLLTVDGLMHLVLGI